MVFGANCSSRLYSLENGSVCSDDPLFQESFIAFECGNTNTFSCGKYFYLFSVYQRFTGGCVNVKIMLIEGN